MKPERISAHPVADLFPLLNDEGLASLADDIGENGLIQPITLTDGLILDGRNRQLACEQAGVIPNYEEFDGDDPVAFVISANLKRRHLTTSQRAMIAEKLATMKQGERTDLPQNCGKSQSDAANQLQVSERSVQTAAKVTRDAAPSIVEAVEAGSISLSQAEQVAKFPKEIQEKVLDEVAELEVKNITKIAKRYYLDTIAEKIPAKKRTACVALIDSAVTGIDQKAQMLSNIGKMTALEQDEIVDLASTGDRRDTEAAQNLAAKVPPPLDPRWDNLYAIVEQVDMAIKWCDRDKTDSIKARLVAIRTEAESMRELFSNTKEAACPTN